MNKATEILIISGKGGTGKTSLTASFALLEENLVLADCDVDAADMHLLFSPSPRRQEIFKAGHTAYVMQDGCVGCGLCAARCRFDAVTVHEHPDNPRTYYAIDALACEGCGVCVQACPQDAIAFPEAECGTWSISDTRAGVMLHGALNPGGENSGKLVALIREEARKVAVEEERDLILIDGPPGVGCPVIASLGGVDLAVVITEPTLSGEHDMLRVLDLARHFSVPACICINKWDLNPDQSQRIENLARERGAGIMGRIPYRKEFTTALRQGKTVMEWPEADVLANEVRKVWQNVKEQI